MEILRTVKVVQNNQIILDLPSNLLGQEVEIIVVTKKISPKKKSLRGALHSYAKPELIPLESSAWENAMEEKHLDR